MLPGLLHLLTGGRHGAVLTVQLSGHHLQLLQVGRRVVDGGLASREVLHSLLQDLLRLGAALQLTRQRTNVVNICLQGDLTDLGR